MKSRRPHRLPLATAVLFLALSAGGCALGAPASDPSRPSEPAARGRSGPVLPVTVTDAAGRTVTVASAERVVTLPIPAASVLIAVDGGPRRLAGVHPSSAQAIREGILGEIFPEASVIPTDVVRGEGFAPNVESILALKPDLVIQWGDRGNEIISPLENAGLTVVGLRYGTQDDLESWLDLFGRLVGKPERAASILDWHRRTRAELERSTAAIGEGRRPKILYFLRLRQELRVSGSGTYNDFYIRLAGGANPAAELQGHAAVTEEQVLAWDPDVILVGNFDGATPADVYRRPLWQGVSAVRARRVYQVPLGGYRWDPPSHEAPLMWRWLTAISHPERVRHDLRAEVARAYRLLYGHEVTVEQVDRILRLDLNRDAAHYLQLFGTGGVR